VARINITRIEELDATFPGLRNKVDAALDRHQTLESIAEIVEEMTGERLQLSVISSYKQRRWLPSVQRIRDITERAAAIHAAYQRFGIGPIAEAVALEKIEEIAPDVLLRESRERLKIEVERKRLDVELGRLEAAKKATDEVVQKARNGESLTIEDIQRIRERVYGIHDAAAGPEA
jgi:hypothetical protein